MTYVGDQLVAAPTLNTVALERDVAETLFQVVLHNVDLMLQHNLIHGDLSAYNILYWQGQITLIDFPQVVNLHANRKARFILQRDIQRTCDYFAQQGVRCHSAIIIDELWRRYGAEIDAEDLAADWSRLTENFDELADEGLIDPTHKNQNRTHK
jgi:RIO kinase 1